MLFVSVTSVSNHGFTKSGNNLAFFEVLGKILEDAGGILVDFWGYFPLFYVILQYFNAFSCYFTQFYYKAL